MQRRRSCAPRTSSKASSCWNPHSWQYVFAATSFAAPIYRSFRKNASGGLEMLFPEHFPTRSQDLPEALHDAGQFYWGRPEAWLSSARAFTGTPRSYCCRGGGFMTSTAKRTGSEPSWCGMPSALTAPGIDGIAVGRGYNFLQFDRRPRDSIARVIGPA